MFSKKTYRLRSLFVKNLGLFILLIPIKMLSQKQVTRIHTDWKGYWTANGKTTGTNRPDDANNLLAFAWDGKTYSTGVNDNILTTNLVNYTPQRFRALKIQTLGLDSGMYILQGSMIDGEATKAILIPALAGTSATGAELASRLTDGLNGLSLGTGIANIKKNTISEFKIGTNNLNINGLDDKIPDIIVTQVAETGGDPDIFKFVDKDGKTVGTEMSIKFGSVTPVGTYSLDLFKADGGTNGFSPADTRDIRILGIETKEFGITDLNAEFVDRFVVTFSGSSDCAFIAFNTNSLKIAELTLVKKGTITSCGKVNDIINYSFEIKNTGEVPITNILITDPMADLAISGNSIAGLAVGASTTIYGTYKIKAGDVTAGKVVNTAKVTGTDPSLNIVEDTSTATTILLAPPTIGTITNVTCNSAGTVILNNLPSTDTWIVERSPGAVKTSGSGETLTITNLPVGNYTFKVTTTAGCNSPASVTVPITDQSSTTWNGTSWSRGLPDATKNAIIGGPITLTTDLTACSCTINAGFALTVATGHTLTLVNGLTVSPTGSLTFENSSSLLQTNTGNTINSGSINYIRKSLPIRQADFVYWSTPVTPQKLVDVSEFTLSDKFMGYNGSNWVITNKNTDMIVGKGYIIRGPQGTSNTSRSPFSTTFKGTPNNGTIKINGDSTIPGGFLAGKFYLLGNPYPSALDADLFITGNKNVLEGTLYFWTHNTPVVLSSNYKYETDDYASYNLSGGTRTMLAAKTGDDATGNNLSEPLGKIAAGQGFFAGFSYAGEITYTNGMRLGGANNSQFFKTGSASKTSEIEKNRLWLNLTNTEGAFKQMLIGYIEGATNNYDRMYDGISFDGNKFVDFYSINNTSKFVIQGRALPFADTDTVPLGYKSTIAGDFTISIDHADGILNTQSIYLEDKTTGKIHDLKAANYTFSTASGTFADRFVLRYTNKTLGTGDFENIENGLLVSVKDKTIKVTSAKETISEVTIFDITGKQLYNKKKIGATELQITNLQTANQVLLVKVTFENDFTTTEKIVFQ